MNGIQPQQKELLMFVKRYFSVQTWALARHLGIKKRDAKDRSERLVKRQMLQSIGTPYGDVYRLAKKGAPIVGVDTNSRLVKTASPVAIARDMAVLRYVFLSNERRIRLTVPELEQILGSFPEHLKNHPYSFDAEEKILTCLRVPDQSSDNAVGEQIAADLFAFENAPPPFPRLLAKGRFRVVVLTFEEARAGAIRAELSPSKTIPLTFQTVPYQPELVRS